MTNIPLSNIATGTAIGVAKKNFGSTTQPLEQKLYAIGQGASATSYTNEKFTASSSGEVGAKVGYGSPLHLMSKAIFPPDGSGALKGAVEVTFYPLDDPSGGVAAQKSIDAVGTQTQAAEIQVRINDLYIPVTIAKDSDNDAVLALIKDAIDAVLSSPVDVASGSGSATSGRVVCGAVSSALSVWTAVTDAEFSVSVDGTPQDVTPATFAGAASFTAIAALIETALTGATCTYDTTTEKFTITSSTTGETSSISALAAAATPAGTDISGSGFLNGASGVADVIPGTDADNILTLTTKWEGSTSDELDVEIIQETVYGVTYIVEDVTPGAGTVDVAPALAAMGEVWYTFLANQFGDSTNLGKISDKNEALWNPLVLRFFLSCVGESNRTAAEAIADARKTDRANYYNCADGCLAWSFEIAAAGAGEMVSRANLESNRQYTGLILSGLTPGVTDQPDHTAQSASLKKGVSTTKLVDGVIKLKDMVTFFHPDSEQPNPGYQWCVDVVKLMNIVNSTKIKFTSADWEAMSILADTDISTLPSVRRPRDVVGAYFGLADDWVQAAWATDADFTKENLVVIKSLSARNRFEATVPVLLADNLRQQDYQINFGFDLGA